MAKLLNYQASGFPEYYAPPKPHQLLRIIICATGSAAFAVIGAAVYAAIQPHLGSVESRLGAAAASALAVGSLGLFVVRHGLVYSRVLAAIIGLAVAVVALYVMWLVWVHHVLQRSGLPLPWSLLIGNPRLFFNLMREINRNGAWELDHNMVRGFPLLVFWLGEACVILSGGIAMPVLGVGKQDLICRDCGRKCVAAARLPRFAADHADELTAAVKSRDFSSLHTFSPPAHGDAPELSLRLVTCRRCDGTNVLTLNRVAWVIGKNKRPQVQIKQLVNQILLTSLETEQLQQAGAAIQQQREQAEQDAAQNSGEVAGG